MKKFYNAYVRTIPKALNLLLIASFVIVLFIEILSNIPEIVPFGEELGKFVYVLCMSYIAAYIFYFVSVHVKEKRDKAIINEYIAQQVFGFLIDADQILSDIKKTSKILNTGEPISKADILAICKSINPNSDAPMLKGPFDNTHVNWYEYLKHYQFHTKERCSKILSRIIFLDAELVSYISKLDDSPLFANIDFAVFLSRTPPGITATNFTNGYEHGFHEYFSDIHKLRQYFNKNLASYLP